MIFPELPGAPTGMSDPRYWRECERCDRVNCECEREQDQQHRDDDMFDALEDDPWA